MKCFYRRAAMWMLAAAAAVGLAGTAPAQQKTLTVAVLPFTNSSGYGGKLTAQTATAAIETQLMDSGRFDVVKRDLVNKTMSDLNLAYPLGRTGMMQLATALEADGVISGDVASVSRVNKTNQLRATLRVEMTDRTSGELTNGAIASGESGVRQDLAGAESVLADEAISKAAFAAVRSMNDRILPEGTVFATSSREGQIEALLNIGTNSGVRQGMEFIVLRNREQVGRIRITSTTPTDSTASVVSSTRGVQPEDKVRAVFRLENIPAELGGTGASASRISRPRTNLGGLAIGALALLGLTKLGHGSFSEGRSARSVMAVSSGPYNGAPAADAVPTVPVVHISWRAPAGVNQQDIIGYAIFREDQLTKTGAPITVAGRGETSFYDTGRAIEVAANDSLATVEGTNDGLIPGQPTRYRIRLAYNVTTSDTGTGGGTGTTTVKIAEDVISPSATPIMPPPAVSSDASNPAAAKFVYQKVPGADRYVIQVSNNPQFTNADTYPKGSEGVATVAPPPPPYPVQYYGKAVAATDTTPATCEPFTGNDCVNIGLDVRTEPTFQPTYSPTDDTTFASINLMTGAVDPTVGTLYWRVGARNSRDDNRPENGGFVWGTMQLVSRSASVAAKPILITRPPAKQTHPGATLDGSGK